MGNVVVISRRPHLRENIESLLRRAIVIAGRSRQHTSIAPSMLPLKGSDIAFLDVLALFPPSGDPVLPMPPSLRSVLVVGFRQDSDAIVAALNRGIHTYPVEDLGPETFGQMVDLAEKPCGLYTEIARVYSRLVRQLLDARQQKRRLTERESEVLSLLCVGYSNSDISQALQIERKTVRNYVSLIREKLDVADRSQVVLRGWEILGPPSYSLADREPQVPER